jgi:YbgC/YbaW family acyl-CoA thioester hydrolase
MKEKSQIFEYPLMIREFHLDTLGHVNNATYVAIFEEARWDLITKRGYGLKEVHEKKISPIILEIEIKFKREVKCRENVVIKSHCHDYKSKIGKITQVLVNEKGEDACEAVITFGLFDMKTRKLISPTQDWLKAVGLND